VSAKFSNFIKNSLLYVKNFRYNRNVGVFLFFLLLSTIFWFFNELENVYVSNISYPVKYTDPPKDKIFVGNLPSHLDLKIRGTGFKLLEYRIGKELMPIEFQVNSYNLKSSHDSQNDQYFLLTQSVRTRISRQLSSDLDIVDITPDTLHFQFANETTRKLAVEAQISYSFGKQFMLKGNIEVEPDSVIASGPNTVLDTVETATTTKQHFKEITENLTKRLPLKKIHPQVEFSERNVKIKIPVEQYTEGALRKEIEVKNLPDSVVLRTFPRYIQITYLAGLSNFENVIPELFKVTVDFKDTGKDSEKLKVSVEKAPDYLKSYSYRPHRVDYIIEKKND
jgi:YbbR domain-containing protein